MLYVLFNPLSDRMGRGVLISVKEELSGQYYKEIDITTLKSYDEVFEHITPEDVIYLVGGDGTLSRFVDYIRTKDINNDMYFYSEGTGNDFRHDVDENREMYSIHINDYIKHLPIVRVNGREYSFINGVGYGIDGFCCEEGDRLKAAGAKRINYTTIAIKGLLFTYKPNTAKITVDGETKEYHNVWLAPTMLGRFYGGGMMVTPLQNRFNPEHTVTVAVMHRTGKLKTLKRFPEIFSGNHVKYTDMMDFRSGHEIKVEFENPCALQIDGETILGVKEYSVSFN